MPVCPLYAESAIHRDYTRESLASGATPRIDFKDHTYVAHVWLYIFCGILDSAWQTAAYWFMGAMSNDPAKLANFSGFCACPLNFAD